MNKPKRLPSLHELDARIKKARGVQKGEDDEQASGFGPTRVSLEFVSPVLVGAFLGYWLDKWFTTTPIFFITGMLLGVLAGGMSVYRLAVRSAEQDDKSQDKQE